nr:transposase [Parageobacillus galactosidasius]
MKKTRKGKNQSFITLIPSQNRIYTVYFWDRNAFHFIYLPPYSPQLNPIERLWKWLKDTVIANVFHKDRNDIIQAITRFVNYIHERLEEVLQRLGCAG